MLQLTVYQQNKNPIDQIDKLCVSLLQTYKESIVMYRRRCITIDRILDIYYTMSFENGVAPNQTVNSSIGYRSSSCLIQAQIRKNLLWSSCGFLTLKNDPTVL